MEPIEHNRSSEGSAPTMANDTWTTDNYPYRGVPLKPQMLAELAERNFPPGSVMPRKWLVEDAPRIHAQLGGATTSSDAVAQANKARATLLEGEWEQAGYGSIRRLGGRAAGADGEGGGVPLMPDDAVLSLDADEWYGDGEETVYCYTFPCHVELAALKGESKMPMKIGKTSSNSLDRVSLQCGVSNPEHPVVLLAIRTENAALVEKAIQRILTIWNRWIDDAPGSEWFMTSNTEVLAILKFLENPPTGDGPGPNKAAGGNAGGRR